MFNLRNISTFYLIVDEKFANVGDILVYEDGKLMIKPKINDGV